MPNPILQRELLYQRRTIPKLLQVVDSVGVIVLVLVVIWLLSTLMVSVAPPTYVINFTLVQWVQVSSWTIHALAVARSILMGADVMRHEGGRKGWEALRLTNVTAFRFLWGKWRAAFYRARGWMVAYGLIQLALVGLLIASYFLMIYQNTLSECFKTIPYYSRSAAGQICFWRIKGDWFTTWDQSSTAILVSSVSMAVGLTLLEIAASTAMGVTAALIMPNSDLSPLIGIGARLLIAVIFSIWPDYYNAAIYSVPPAEIRWWRWSEYSVFSLADGGTTALMRIASYPGMAFPVGRSESVPFVFGLATALFIALWVSSMVAGWLMLRRTA